MLPDKCKPGVLASRRERLCGELPASGLRRLRRAVDHAAGAVQVSLEFERDETGRAGIIGRLQAPVRVICQRCLAPFDMCLEAMVDVLVVRPEEEAGQPAPGREVLRMREDTLLLHEMIEDELLLALPMHTVHPRGRCSPPASSASGAAEAAVRPSHPFAALAAFKDPTH